MIGNRRVADEPDADPAFAGPTDTSIELRNLSLAYGRHLVLSGVCGKFPAGSLTAVVGANGAGKSSLLDVLAGIRRPTGGEVICPTRARRRLAFLPSRPGSTATTR